MAEIKVIEKPKNISWEAVREVIVQAHSENIKNGIVMRTTTLSGEELKERVGAEGRCFVAMDGDKIIGTGSVGIKTAPHWYVREPRYAYYLLGAILPDYQGCGAYKMLNQARENFVREHGIHTITTDTAETNVRMLKLLQHVGFKKVGCFASTFSKHYSIIMAKYLEAQPYSGNYIAMRYKLSLAFLMFRFKRGGIKRWGI